MKPSKTLRLSVKFLIALSLLFAYPLLLSAQSKDKKTTTPPPPPARGQPKPPPAPQPHPPSAQPPHRDPAGPGGSTETKAAVPAGHYAGRSGEEAKVLPGG